MSDKVKTGSDDGEEVKLPEIAYGIAKNMKTGEWEVIKVGYDPVSGAAKVVEHVHTGGYRMMAEEVFRITVATELMI
jgi:hypothetical protein